MGLLNLYAVFQAARDEKVGDFGALNGVRPEAESNPVAAGPEVAPVLPPETCYIIDDKILFSPAAVGGFPVR